ncbi:uncharacterized protein PV09_04454 [Verruconis gallopava]|uniref:Zn(2)-C6 fungal-type domain-containing protein n=1 Tax=Verruconis gallopava TaxID=253628 RepID=A0A0D1XQ60_9PEZI|nr:uncharacterized protein PV09_04454 [Verruconis gallopava]KIW04721.1 hypothetical protein PV09_04454 [Verruconis gallopava]
MPVRQSHTKSRLGCKQCKARHVRCDQNSPKCGLCKRRGVECSLSASYAADKQGLLQPRIDTPRRETPSTEGTASSQIGTPTPPKPELVWTRLDIGQCDDSLPWDQDESLPLKELELLHHFTTVTAFTLGKEKTLHESWQTAVPQLGLKYSYLMYGIFAVSALHMYTTSKGIQSAREYHDLALHYYDLASSRFRNTLQVLSGRISFTQFATSSLLCLFILASRMHIPSANGSRCLDDLSTLHNLVKGVTVIATDCDALTESRDTRHPLLNPEPWDDVILAPNIEAALHRMTVYAESLSNNGPRREAYHKAINALRETFKAVVANPGRTTLPFFWFMRIQRDFVDLVEKRDPVALVIVAWHARLLERYSEEWWLGGRGEAVLNEIMGLLGEDCTQIQVWPREALVL